MTITKKSIDLIFQAKERVWREIESTADYGSEKYLAGYRDALDDILLLITGTIPSRRGYWSNHGG